VLLIKRTGDGEKMKMRIYLMEYSKVATTATDKKMK
jgi:hypothetical protein